jgi:hypothetical protein
MGEKNGAYSKYFSAIQVMNTTIWIPAFAGMTPLGIRKIPALADMTPLGIRKGFAQKHNIFCRNPFLNQPDS